LLSEAQPVTSPVINDALIANLVLLIVFMSIPDF